MTQIAPVRWASPGVHSGSSWLTEPRWQPARPGPARWPRALRAWLLDQGSLTAKLQRLSGGEFQLQVLFQGMARPNPSERNALGLRSGQWALIREVVLKGHGQPWVFARSLIPMSSLTGRVRQLRQLDNRPLGAFLFSQPDLIRGAMEISRIRPEQDYVPPRLQGNAILWGRRSAFWLEARPLLVSEVFLPAFVQHLRSND